MTIQGYLEWSPDFLAGPMILDGRVYEQQPLGLSWGQEADVAAILMENGTTVVQQQLAGPDAPAGLSPFQVTFDLRCLAPEDFYRLEEAKAAGRPVSFFPRWWQVDVWWIAAGGSGRTTWRTSRRLPYELSGITSATLPASAYLDGVQLTDVAADPAAGEIVIPDENVSEGYVAELETESGGLDGTRLTLRYPAEYYVLVQSLQRRVERSNLLVASVTLQETILGAWSSF